MAKKWIQKVVKRIERRGTKGAFSKEAKKHGMDTLEYANKVLADAKDQEKPLSEKMLKKVRRAIAAKNMIKASKRRK